MDWAGLPMREVLSWVGIVAGAAAAGLWLFASVQFVRYRDDVDEKGWAEAAHIEVRDDGTEVDVWKTASRQTYWNAWAALAASIAAGCQVATQLL